MKKNYWLFLGVFQLFSWSMVAQENAVKHIVKKDETVISIAQKYKVTPNDLYKSNPDLVNGIEENSVLIIPQTKVVVNKPEQISNSVNKENEIISHRVQQGETKFGLSKRYGVSIEELERQNPQIVRMLQEGHLLTIKGGRDSRPKAIQTENLNINFDYITYEVQSGETLYGLSKRFGTTVNTLIDVNNLQSVLRSGQILKIPTKQKTKTSEISQGNVHIVVAGETKYGLSKRYGVTIEELERLNPHIVRMLQTGHEVVLPFIKNQEIASKEIKQEVITKKEEVASKHVISAAKDNPKEEVVAQSKNEVKENREEKPTPKTESVVEETNTSNLTDWVDYEIQPKQTLFGLSKIAGVSQEKMLEINPILNEGVKAGTIIKLPSNAISAIPIIAKAEMDESKSASVENNPAVEKTIEVKGLMSSLNKIEKKEIALLVPFSKESYETYLKSPSQSFSYKDEMEFYLGASIAIDSIKKLGVTIDEKLVNLGIDKEARIDFSNLKKLNLQQSNALFYYSNQTNTEKLSDFALKSNIPLIVNQIEEGNTKVGSTYVGIPSQNDLAIMILNYIAAKNGNLIVVSDEISSLNHDFIESHFPKARFVKSSSKGVLEEEVINKELIMNRINFVLLNTEKSGLILNTTTALLKDMQQYQIQLALLKPKELVLNESLSEMRFKALKMIYPSYSKRDNQIALKVFENKCKQNYGIASSPQIIQGFDLTFDALIRLYQNKSLETLAKDEVTNQLNYTFQYYKNQYGGYYNKGAYILQYDIDSDKKIVN